MGGEASNQADVFHTHLRRVGRDKEFFVSSDGVARKRPVSHEYKQFSPNVLELLGSPADIYVAAYPTVIESTVLEDYHHSITPNALKTKTPVYIKNGPHFVRRDFLPERLLETIDASKN